MYLYNHLFLKKVLYITTKSSNIATNISVLIYSIYKKKKGKERKDVQRENEFLIYDCKEVYIYIHTHNPFVTGCFSTNIVSHKLAHIYKSSHSKTLI